MRDVSPSAYTPAQRLVAVMYGVVCHLSFALGIAAMMAGIYTGLQFGRGPFRGGAAAVFDLLLLAQFAVLHSVLLLPRGRALLARLAPLGLGRDLSTTIFACLSSLQLLLTFGAWAPLGPVWWEPQGAVRIGLTLAYGAAWLLLLKAMADAGLGLQTGFLGWSAVARGRAPRYAPFAARGTYRYTRQPIYVAFTLTLWTGPVWTLDHLLLATAWTLYCLTGPLLKERRYLAAYGAHYARYRERVPYWLPARRGLSAAVLDAAESGTDAAEREAS